jgi:hypothetical protein
VPGAPGAPGVPGGYGGGGGSGWQPLAGGASVGGGSAPQSGSLHTRTEFVLLFVWKEPTPSDALRGDTGAPPAGQQAPGGKAGGFGPGSAPAAPASPAPSSPSPASESDAPLKAGGGRLGDLGP